MAHALKTKYYRGLLDTRLNPHTIGCVWTGDFDLNTLRVDGKILNPERKSCGLKTIRIRVEKALKYIVHFHVNVLQIQMSTLAATTLFALSVACIFHSSRCSKNSIRMLQYNKITRQLDNLECCTFTSLKCLSYFHKYTLTFLQVNTRKCLKMMHTATVLLYKRSKIDKKGKVAYCFLRSKKSSSLMTMASI